MPAAIPSRGRPTVIPERPAEPPISLDDLFPVIYDELRRIAHRQLGHEATGHTLNTTGLVHEVYLRLQTDAGMSFTDRAHFFALAGRAMRRVLVDCARRFRSARRGGGIVPRLLEDRDVPLARAEELLDLDDALTHLEATMPRQARVVEFRFFAGLSEQEIARLLDVTERTVRRDWVSARAWLYDHLRTAT
jgi:RNA polymerase sigma factor (TIGR02999 family)